MGQLKKILASLSLRQRIAIILVALLAGAGVFGFARWRKESDFKPLFTGLAAEDSAAIVQKLKESGSEYRLSEAGDAVLVPSARLAELRLDMAASGLPKTGRIGFEIFDKTNLGATEFVEHINYQRALEGELERSVAALAEVKRARVHVSFPKDSVFLDSREPAKASVLVEMRPGARLSPRNVAAIEHLVASAVEGLDPAAVSVLDMNGNLLSKPISSPEEQQSEAALDYRQKVERDLIQKIDATLDPLLGHERFRASVSADCDLSSAEQSEETVDPTRSVMLSSQKTEEVSAGGTAAAGGLPGTASNLPRPAARQSGYGSSSTRRSEDITYQSSRIVRKTKLPQGGIKRLSVAVLLDQDVSWQGAGQAARRVVTPPSAATLQTVRNLVTAAVGFDQNRGDLITVETLPFEATLSQPGPAAPPASASPATRGPRVLEIGKVKLPLPVVIAAAAALLLLILLGVAFFIWRGLKKVDSKPELNKTLPGSGAGLPAIEGGGTAEEIEAKMAERAALQKRADQALLASIKVPPVKSQKADVLLKELRENAKKDPTASAQVIQSWLHERT